MSLTRLGASLALCFMVAEVSALMPAGKSSPYLRLVQTGDGSLELQTASVSLRSPTGGQIDIYACTHIAEEAYYESMKAKIGEAGYDQVFYELILPQECVAEDPNGWRRVVSETEITPPPHALDFARGHGLTPQLGALGSSLGSWCLGDLTKEEISSLVEV